MKFGFGPMSVEVIEAIYQYSHQHKIELMLIASKNQIDYDGGYVNNWTTQDYITHLDKLKKRYPQSNIMICRDHCGPGFKRKDNDNLYDTNHTIAEDINCGFHLIHVDLCRYTKDIIKSTIHTLEYARKLNPNIEFEIGTDDIGKITDINTFGQSLIHFVDFDPLYYVANTGSLIKENKQIGHFDRYHTSLTHTMLNEYNIGLKEHNSDYLSSSQIKLRKGRVDAMNIAPQLGVVQTTTILAEAQKYGINVDDFVNLVYNNKRWQKWDNGNLKGNPYLSTIVAGHYHYTSDEYKKVVGQLGYRGKNLITQNIKDVIYHYVTPSK